MILQIVLLLLTQSLLRFDFRGTPISHIQVFSAPPSVYDGMFCKKSESPLAFNNFFEKIQSQMFERVLNLQARNKILLSCKLIFVHIFPRLINTIPAIMNMLLPLSRSNESALNC